MIELDKILISRLSTFIETCEWKENEIVTIDDINKGIKDNVCEQIEPYDNLNIYNLHIEEKEWHIGRIIYFINHEDEITGITIDNYCDDSYVYPVPIIINGNHRWMAALWLNKHGKKEFVECSYGGRLDLLDYLIGKSDKCPTDWD